MPSIFKLCTNIGHVRLLVVNEGQWYAETELSEYGVQHDMTVPHDHAMSCILLFVQPMCHMLVSTRTDYSCPWHYDNSP